MKVIVIGGAGDMGRVACVTAADDPAIESVVVADRDGARAGEVARSLGTKGSSLVVDITDSDGLVAAISDVDLVLNTAGPFYLFGRPVLEAAIAAGKHYADIADDWEPTVEMFEADAAAREAGIVALVGMGASPGVSNLLAAVAHAQLDTVESLHTVWRGGSGIPKAPESREDVKPAAALDHWIHNLAEPIRLWREGRYQDVDALETFEISYPGIGAGQVWTCGHPEPITLPRTFPEILNSYNIMFSRPGLIDNARIIRDRVRAGEIDVPTGSTELVMMPGRRGPEAGPVPDFPGVFAYAEGTKDGKQARATVATNVLPPGAMGEATCIPLAVAAGMIARGEVTSRGVVSPEAAIDPQVFFERLAPFTTDLGDKPLLDIRMETN